MGEERVDEPPISITWLRFARRIVELTAGYDPAAATEAAPPESRSHGGVFVTLHKLGRLRGCMGTLDATRPLGEAIREAAISAAVHDPRFSPVFGEELPTLRVELSILSPAQMMRDLAELVIGRHGIIVSRAGRRGLFLPQVAVEHELDKETFLARCCVEKAGLPPNAWRDPQTQVELFTTTVLAEP